MDTRYTPEQAELARTARRLVRELGARSVADLDDAKRARRLAEAVREAGWLELRDDDGAGAPVASGVEAAIIAEVMGEAVADVPFAGPVLASDLARRTGAPPLAGAVVGFAPDLIDVAVAAGPVTSTPICAVDRAAAGRGAAYVLVPEGDGFRLAQVALDDASRGADLTRSLGRLAAGAPLLPVPGQTRRLTRGDLDAWAALGLALTSADLVGGMRGVIELSVAYARERKQYGVAIGTFQAVQHLLAEAHTLMEGAYSAALHPAWGADPLAPREALLAGRVAKAYCARAARSVCETAVQVHGGMGNTWDCMVHVHLRRALLSSRWFGDDGEQLAQLGRERLGEAHGLS